MCFVHLLLLELDQATGIAFNISYYSHCRVLRHLPNAERSEFQTGRNMFICLQKHFSRAASCGHTIIQGVPAPMTHASKLKGSMKTDLQNHTHFFHNHFPVNYREKYVDFWVYKTWFLPNQCTELLFSLKASFTFYANPYNPVEVAACCAFATIHIEYTLSWDSCLNIGWNKVQEKSKYCSFSSGSAQTCCPGCSWAWLRGGDPAPSSNCFFPRCVSPTKGVPSHRAV